MHMTTPVVTVEDVSVVLSGRPVVRRVSLRVLSGEFVTLLGANGSGKSTLVRTIVGLLPATSGSVELFGIPQQQFRDWRRVGYVPQRSTAQSGVPATVDEVVTTGRLSRHRFIGWPTRSDRAAVAEALEIVRLADRGRDSVAQLSGGQQQRVMIARALAAHPDLLVLDEPTAGVDHASQVVLADVFADLVARGTTILLVAHELGPLTPLVDRSIVLRDGRIVFEGDAEQAVLDLGLGEHHHPDGPTPPRVPLTDDAAWGHGGA
jgi:zinc transport system ATP-binding protein